MAFLEGELVLDRGGKTIEAAVCVCVSDSYRDRYGHSTVSLFALFSPDGTPLISKKRRRTRKSSVLTPYSTEALKNRPGSSLPYSALHRPAQIKRAFFKENPDLVLSYAEMAKVVDIVDENGRTKMTLSFPAAD